MKIIGKDDSLMNQFDIETLCHLTNSLQHKVNSEEIKDSDVDNVYHEIHTTLKRLERLEQNLLQMCARYDHVG